MNMNLQLPDDEPQVEPDAPWSFRRVCGLIFVVLMLVLAVAVRISIMSTGVRVLLVVTLMWGLFVVLLHLLRFLKSYHGAVYPVLFFLVFAILWNVLGNKPYDVNMLRAADVKRLTAFRDVRFVWGGETTNGIDCSGLARVAMWQAMLRQGIRELNPRLLGTNLWKFWWRDMSAGDIGRGKYGYTKVIGHASKLAGYDTSSLKPADMAVADSAHVMIYFGKGRWIEANPDDKKVVVNSAPANSNRSWFKVPVTLVRWRFLEDGM
jgi:hypothetical protein